MAHIFGFPAGAAHTVEIRLDPSLVTIQEEQRAFVQRHRETPDGTQWVFQLAATRPQTFEVLIEDLHEDNRVTESETLAGYTSLWAFFDATVNGMMNLFDLRHEDGLTTVVRLMSPEWEFAEGLKGRWRGRLRLRKSVTDDPRMDVHGPAHSIFNLN